MSELLDQAAIFLIFSNKAHLKECYLKQNTR